MKALSLWQPWATLIAIGAKRFETRSWSTTYRGPLLIHAAKRPNEARALARAIAIHTRIDGRIIGDIGEFERYAISALYTWHNKTIGTMIPKLPLGAGLCIVDLVDCIPTVKIAFGLSKQELLFGNYDSGRFAWLLDNVRIFPKPESMRGAQGLFDYQFPDPLDGRDDPRYR